jgi:hypothetical protein
LLVPSCSSLVSDRSFCLFSLSGLLKLLPIPHSNLWCYGWFSFSPSFFLLFVVFCCFLGVTVLLFRSVSIARTVVLAVRRC